MVARDYKDQNRSQSYTRQGDLISGFFFLALETLSLLIKYKSDIEWLAVFDYWFVYSAYTDDRAFFIGYYFYKIYA